MTFSSCFNSHRCLKMYHVTNIRAALHMSRESSYVTYLTMVLRNPLPSNMSGCVHCQSIVVWWHLSCLLIFYPPLSSAPLPWMGGETWLMTPRYLAPLSSLLPCQSIYDELWPTSVESKIYVFRPWQPIVIEFYHHCHLHKHCQW